jgi:amino acid adenylation domain-containing protein
MSLNRYLNSTAERFPERIAVTDGRFSITFGELDSFSDRLGRFLMALGASRGERVVYFLKRSPACITATMGILKSGAAYVPLDQKTPLERWRRIVEDAAPAALLCNKDTIAETQARRSSLGLRCPVVCLDPREDWNGSGKNIFFIENIVTFSDVALPDIDLNDLAEVLYTSGSTGTPKGVMITHGNIENYIDWAIEYFSITVEDHLLGTAPFYFDMSTFDIFCAIAAGATLSVATEDLLLFPEKLVRFMERQNVTLWKGVSSLLMYMCRAGVIRPGRLPSLRTVIYAGESLNPQYLSRWMQAFPEKSFFNGYGPTEATGVSLCYHVDHLPEIGRPIPIGYPRNKMKAVLLGEDGLPVAPGETGELCIAGPGLAKGYLNDPEKTKKQFTSPPPECRDLGDRIYHTGDLACQNPDGSFVFIARKDHQVKWMGYRIELAEIETNLIAQPQMKDAVVLLAESGGGLTELVAFFEADENLEPTILSHFLEQRIPHYMIPKRFIQIESLPHNDRGKIARDELLRMYAEMDKKTSAEAH